LARRELKINNLQSDLQDGTLLNHFIEIVNSTKVNTIHTFTTAHKQS